METDPEIILEGSFIEPEFIVSAEAELQPEPFRMCKDGVIQSLQAQILPIVVVAFISRFISANNKLPSCLKHLWLIGAGIWVLSTNTADIRLLLTEFVVIAVLLSQISLLSSRSRGFVVTASGIISIMVIEFRFLPEEASVIRGVLMIVVMKLSSLAFDEDDDDELYSDFLGRLAYVLNPSTILFGPFHRYEDFERSLQYHGLFDSVIGFLSAVASFAIATGFVLASSCGTEFYYYPDTHWIVKDYGYALGFRMSHYFVCLVAQGLSYMGGFEYSKVTVNPVYIEAPRSLVGVVTSWNIPMHEYLKSYVYEKSKLVVNRFASIFVTFLISSLLHGLNSQLSAVLLTLGYLCYTENRLRERLSRRFSACVRARKCTKCNHIRKNDAIIPLVINLFFSILAIYNLIYLGMVFDGSGAETGYPISHTISVWKRHYFGCHAVGILFHLLSFFV